MQLANRLKLCMSELPPCCLESIEYCEPSSVMEWTPPNSENNKDNVKRVSNCC